MKSFPSIHDKRLAELVGIILGDGMITNTYQNKIEITLNKNEIRYAHYINNLIFDLFGIKGKIHFRKKENTLDIFIHKKIIINFFIEKVGLIAAPKKNRAKIPKFIIGTRLENYFLRGLFDTDGCFTVTDNNNTLYVRLEIKACPSPMREQLIEILKRRGFRFGVYQIGNGVVRIQMNGYSQLFKWLEEIGTKNPNQLDKIEEVVVAGLGFEPRTSRLAGISQPDLRVMSLS